MQGGLTKAETGLSRKPHPQQHVEDRDGFAQPDGHCRGHAFFLVAQRVVAVLRNFFWFVRRLISSHAGINLSIICEKFEFF
jgi:hypothetical protein